MEELPNVRFTIIWPLLRQAKLKPRPAAILKWEGIIVDPFGALLAVFAFEFIRFINNEVTLNSFLLFFAASIFAIFLGWGVGVVLGHAFERGGVPEYIKVAYFVCGRYFHLLIGWIAPRGIVALLQAQAGDTIVALTSPAKSIERVIDRLDEENKESEISVEKLEEFFMK